MSLLSWGEMMIALLSSLVFTLIFAVAVRFGQRLFGASIRFVPFNNNSVCQAEAEPDESAWRIRLSHSLFRLDRYFRIQLSESSTFSTRVFLRLVAWLNLLTAIVLMAAWGITMADESTTDLLLEPMITLSVVVLSGGLYLFSALSESESRS